MARKISIMQSQIPRKISVWETSKGHLFVTLSMFFMLFVGITMIYVMMSVQRILDKGIPYGASCAEVVDSPDLIQAPEDM